MTYSFKDYNNDTAFTRELGNPISAGYAVLGWLGETWEVLEALEFSDCVFDCKDTLMGHLIDAEQLKKEVRRGKATAPEVNPRDLLAVKKELGDALWYLNTLALSLGTSLEEVAQINVEKLQKRHKPALPQ